MTLDNSLAKKTILVTGANGTIGKAISAQIAAKGYEVVMVCRNSGLAEAARKEILQTVSGDISIEIADLSQLSEIKALAGRIQKPVFALVNNACITPRQRLENPDGIELQFATNVLGYFRMSLAFRPHLKKQPGSRIVNVASFWAGDLDLKDLQFRRRHYDNNTAYRQSKQANRMLTVALAEHFRPDEILVNCCHPGEVNSKLSNSMGFSGSHTPEKGAETPVWLATTGMKVTGKWFEYLQEQPCRFAAYTAEIEKLFEICEGFSGGSRLY